MKKAKKVLTRNCHCAVCGTLWKIHPKDLRRSFLSLLGSYYVLECKICHQQSVRWYLHD